MNEIRTACMSDVIQSLHSLGYWGINPPACERGKTIL